MGSAWTREHRLARPAPIDPATSANMDQIRFHPERPARPRSREAFEEFQATVLFCGQCRSAQPVRERLLLVLPDGELHEYLCSTCGASVGSRRVSGAPGPLLAP